MKLPSVTDSHACSGGAERVGSVSRVLLIADSYLPTVTSTAKLVKDLLDELVHRGLAVTVLVPSADASRACEVTIEDGVEVIRIQTGKVKGAGKILRAFRELSFSRRIWRRARATLSLRNFDLIIFFSPTIFFGPLVQRLKIMFGCPAYLVVRDLWTQFMLDVEELRPGLVCNYLVRMERKQYLAADVIGVQSPRDLEYLNGVKLPATQKTEVLFNWYTSACGRGRTNYREQLGLSGRVVFFFGGNFGVAQDPLNILRLAAALKQEKHLHFLLVGWGSCVPKMQEIISEQNLDNVTLLSAIPQGDFVSLLEEIDVGLVSLDRRFKINNLPGRFLAYLAAGRPVLASVNPGNDLFSILGDRKAGYCCENGQDQLLREYALVLAGDPVLREDLGRHARHLLETAFSPKHAVDQIVSHFTDVRSPEKNQLAYRRKE